LFSVLATYFDSKQTLKPVEPEDEEGVVPVWEPVEDPEDVPEEPVDVPDEELDDELPDAPDRVILTVLERVLFPVEAFATSLYVYLLPFLFAPLSR
jgi:hypothetical protein